MTAHELLAIGQRMQRYEFFPASDLTNEELCAVLDYHAAVSRRFGRHSNIAFRTAPRLAELRAEYARRTSPGNRAWRAATFLAI